MTPRSSVEMVLKSEETTTQSMQDHAGSAERETSLRTWFFNMKRARTRRT
jgi:hypothetical protein